MLNKQSGNMYAWVTHTWNPIKGYCPHECCYCYMKRFSVGDLRLDQKELRTNLGTGNFIFVGSGTDAFCEDVPSDWIVQTFEHCRKYDNKYLFQSKNPKRFKEFVGRFPDKIILGTTLESNRLSEGISKAPGISERVKAIKELSHAGYTTMITIEPILEFDLEVFLDALRDCQPSWVNIGADSKGNKLPEPNQEQVTFLIDGLGDFTEVHQKKNLNRLTK